MKRIFTTLFLFSALSASSAHAFTLLLTNNGSPVLGWGIRTLSFDTNLSSCGLTSDQIRGLLQDAINVWNGVPSTNFSITLGNDVTTTASAGLAKSTPGTPLIVCETNFQNVVFPAGPGVSGNEADVIPAATFPNVISSDRRLAYATIVLNAESGRAANIATVYNYNPTVLTLILAHEIGHAIGLGHSASTDALMYFDASSKEVLSLSQDDIDGITWLYPRKEGSNSKLFGCGSLIDTSAGSGDGFGPGAVAFVELAMMLFLFRWASRRAGADIRPN